MRGVSNILKGGFSGIMSGNQKFIQINREFKSLLDSQHPEFVVISCSDSRVSPSITMDQPLGSIFEIRIAGQVIDESSLASVEFAVGSLGVKKILMVGHTGCGAVTEAQRTLNEGLKGEADSENSSLQRMVNKIAAIISGNPEYAVNLDAAIMHNAKEQANALLESSIIRNCLDEGSLEIRVALYDLTSGKLTFM